jgi:hypothetical protein
VTGFRPPVLSGSGGAKLLEVLVVRRRLGEFVLADELPDDPVDLSFGAPLADEPLDQDQVLLAHTSTVAAAFVAMRHRCGNQVANR